MLSKTQFKEWFDYKYELSATTAALLGSQLSRIFSGLTTAYLITFIEYLPSIV
jgi:pheromone shutdown protein TraB